MARRTKIDGGYVNWFLPTDVLEWIRKTVKVRSQGKLRGMTQPELIVELVHAAMAAPKVRTARSYVTEAKRRKRRAA